MLANYVRKAAKVVSPNKIHIPEILSAENSP